MLSAPHARRSLVNIWQPLVPEETGKRCVCSLRPGKALIVNAPESLREQLRRGTTDQQLDRCSRLRTLPGHPVEHRATVRAIRAVARRALMLEAEAAEYETDLEGLVVAACPELLAKPGVGVITAAQFLVSWSYSKRIRN